MKGVENMIYTSRYSNPELKTGKYTAIRISLGSPRWQVGYTIAGAIKCLMPCGLLGKYDNDKPGYEREYRKLLDKAGVTAIKSQLDEYAKFGKNIVLLCYEDIRKGENDWCHRTMFAEWWKEKTGEVIEELFDPTTPKIEKPKKKAEPKQQQTEAKEEDAGEQLSMF